MRPGRAQVVVGLLVLCLALVVTSRPTWVFASTAAAGTPTDVAVSGADAAPVVPAVAIVLAACAAALTLARRRARLLVLVVVLLGALAAAGVSAAVALDPSSAARGMVAERVGVTSDSVRGLTARATLWPWLTAVLSLAAAALAGLGLAAARRWETDQRHEARPETVTDDDPAATWDALSRGDDPTQT